MIFDDLKFNKPRPKELAVSLPSQAIESSDGQTAKATIYRLENGLFQSIVNINNHQAIGTSTESPEMATEEALTELGKISEQNDPVWTVKYNTGSDSM